MMEGAKDPVYLTYFMMDWKRTPQSPSDDTCVICGRPMLRVEPITTETGAKYEGRVCHNCRVLYWIKND